MTTGITVNRYDRLPARAAEPPPAEEIGSRAFGSLVEEIQKPDMVAATPRRQQRQSVYVIDDFTTPLGGIRGLTHGGVVAGLLKAEGIRVTELYWGNPLTGELSMGRVADHLQTIMRKHRGAYRDVFVNLSFGINPEARTEFPEEWRRFSAALRQAVALGINIVVGGGNTGYNPISDIPGVITAGPLQNAKTPARDRLYESPQTDARANARVDISVLRSGLDLNGDGRADLPLPPPLSAIVGGRFDLVGTSYSAPRVIKKMILDGARYRDLHAPPKQRS